MNTEDPTLIHTDALLPSIHALPDELIIEHIFTSLRNLRDLVAAEAVCRRWRSLIFGGIRTLEFFGGKRPNQEFVQKFLCKSTRATTISFDFLSNNLVDALKRHVSLSVTTLNVLSSDSLAYPANVFESFPNLKYVSWFTGPYGNHINQPQQIYSSPAAQQLFGLAVTHWPETLTHEHFQSFLSNINEFYCVHNSGTHPSYLAAQSHFKRMPTSKVFHLALPANTNLLIHEGISKTDSGYIEHIRPHLERDSSWMHDYELYKPEGVLERICRVKRVDLLKDLLDSGINLNVANSGATPPIFIAIRNRDLAMIDLILQPEYNQNVDLRAQFDYTKLSFTPLLWNAYYHVSFGLHECKEDINVFEAIMLKLLEKGASVNATIMSEQSPYDHADCVGKNVLQLIMLRPGASKQLKELIKRLLRLGAKFPEKGLEFAWSSVKLPIVWNDEEMFDLFCNQTHMKNYYFSKTTTDSLICAIQCKAVSIALKLCPCIADIVTPAQAKGVVSECLVSIQPKILAQFFSELFLRAKRLVENKKELLDLEPLRNLLQDLPRRLTRRDQVEILETLISHGVASCSELGIECNIMSAIEFRNAHLSSFLLRHFLPSELVPSKKEGAIIAECMAASLFFPSRLTDVWFQILKLCVLDFGEVDFLRCIQVAASNGNKYFLSLFRRLLDTETSSDSLLTSLAAAEQTVDARMHASWVVV